MGRQAKKSKGERLPSYRLHKATGQACVDLSGKTHYLGKHGTPASRKRYQELVAQWLANGRQPIRAAKAAEAAEDDDALTVAELALQFVAWADGHYRKPDGRPTTEPPIVRLALKSVVEKFGALPVDSFGPNALRVVRDEMIAKGWARTTINMMVHRIRRCFTWGVGRELVRPEVIVALSAVEGLRAGRSSARETAPTAAPPAGWLEAVLPHLKEPFRSLLLFQRYTACRAGEALQLTPAMIDRSGPTWFYVPASHKTQHHGKTRRIPLGPRARAVLEPLLEGWPTHQRVFMYRSGPRRGRTFVLAVYCENIERACKKAGVDYYRPHSLRHWRLTEVRDQLGIDVAQAVGGHSSVNMTAHYAKLGDAKSAAAAEASG